MKNPERRPYISLLLALVMAGSLAACSRYESSSGDLEEPDAPMTQESRDVTLEISDEGVIRLVLEAGHMVRFEDPDSVYTVFQESETDNRVRALFFDSLGQETGRLASERVLFDEIKRVMIARGDVVLESSDGRRLQSETIIWDEVSHSVEAPGFVSLTTEEQNIRGYELVASEDLDRWTLKRPTGTVQIREE